MQCLVVGCGYLGLRVARGWREQGHRVRAVTRSAARGGELRAAGLEPLVADVTSAATLPVLADVQVALFAAAPDKRSGQTPEAVYVEGLRNVLQALAPDVRLIFISSTGVFGESYGEWVDETAPCRPRRESARAIFAAEELLRASRQSERSVVLRLAGIYGPGRVPNAQVLRTGAPLETNPESWLNLIHVDDAARIVLAAAEGAPAPLYVVSDGCPVQRAEFYQEAARILGAPVPTFAAPRGPAPTRGQESRRVNSGKLRQELAVPLLYPTYREGLRQALLERWG